MRAHAASHRRMPPVLHVSFAELAPGGAEKMFAQQAGLGMHQGHGVLQLIAKAKRAAGLVKSRPRPHATCQRLVHEPAVGQEVHGRIGRFDVDRAQRSTPVMPNSFQGGVSVAGAAEALNELPCLLIAAGRTEDEDDVLFLAVLERHRNLHGDARIEPGADAAGEPDAAQGGGIRRRAVAAEEFGAVAGDRADRFAASTKTTRSANSLLYGLRAKSAPQTGSTSVTTCMSDLSRSSPSTNSQ